MSYVEAIAAVTLRNMEKDDRFLYSGRSGEFAWRPLQSDPGIKEKFPQRLINTPISEAGFVGMGEALHAGMRPVVEIMFPDFALVASDQLFNQIGKLRHMYGGRRAFAGGPNAHCHRTGLRGQHSMNPVGLFGLFSGWRIMALAPASIMSHVQYRGPAGRPGANDGARRSV